MTSTFIPIDNPLAVNGIWPYSEGINDNGTIVGTYYDSNDVSQGFLDVGGSFTILTDPVASTVGTFAFGINNSGEVVGSFYTQTNVYGYVYLGGAYTTINDPLGTGTW